MLKCDVIKYSVFMLETESAQVFVFTRKELDILEELNRKGRTFAVSLYMFSLRRKMDMYSGVVGLSSKVNYKSLDEIVERNPERGSHLGCKKRTRRQIRYDLECLKKSGLIDPFFDESGKPIPLTFRLPFAFLKQIHSDEERHYERHFQNQKIPENSESCQHVSTEEQHDERHTSYILQQQQELLEKVVQIYHKNFPKSPKVVQLKSETLMKNFSKILQLDHNYRKISFWEWYFGTCVKRSEFLMGVRFDYRLGRFKLNFAGLIKPNILEKAVNSEFH